MQISLHVSGTVNVVHQIQTSPGESPPAVTAADLEALGAKLMSALSDKIAEVKSSVDAAGASADAAIARVQGDVTTLKAQIADLNAQIVALQAQIDAGNATPADTAALDALKAKAEETQAKLDALDPSSPSTLPPPAPTPTP